MSQVLENASLATLQGPVLAVVFPAVAGLIDSLIYHSTRAIQKKIDLGKTT